MNPAVISVLTKGLSCGHSSACEGGTALTAGFFTLWCNYERPPVIPVYGTSGGGKAHPNALSGDIAQPTTPTLNNPHNSPDLVYIDPAKVMGKRVPVKLNFKMGKYEVEKIYTVSVSKVDVMVRMMNFVNVSKKKFKASVTNLKRKTGKASILYKRGHAFISKRRDFD